MLRLLSAANSASMVSSTTRLAPTASMAAPRRMNRPSRLYSPVSMISSRSIVTASITSFLLAIRSGRSKPSELTFCARSLARSSKHMKTPGSLCSWMPRTRNSRPISVLPLPEPPQISVGRPRGRPPPVMVSRPWIPVGHFASFGGDDAATAFWGRRMGGVSLCGSRRRRGPVATSSIETETTHSPAGVMTCC